MGSRNYAIVLAAGKGTRMNRQINKVYLPLKDKPIIAHTLEAFYRVSLVHGIVIVISPGEEDLFRERILETYPPQKPVKIVPGGAKRQDSVYNGLKALSQDTGIVLIHDGARPLITTDIIHKSIKVAEKYGAAVVGVPVKDTIKKLKPDGSIEKTIDRSLLWHAQTPQTFRYSLIMEAHSKARQEGYIATDDSALVEHLGRAIYMLQGDYNNIKITTPDDLTLGEEILSRTGRD